ncbi:MAG: PfkB family carbohydrate kinase [Trueperaceae bacterium]|nr:PfkB family carbohydrate kinase [Trueperaceae bacterium]
MSERPTPSAVHAVAGGALDSQGKRPLVVVGDVVWDVLIRTNTELLRGGDTFGEVELAPGGSAANAAVWARRCGLPTAFVGKVGRDRFGALAEAGLAEEQVEACLVRTDAHLTGTVAVWIDHDGQRSMVSGKGADHMLLPQELPADLIASARHVHLSAWSFFDDPPRSAARRAGALAKAAGATLSLDPGSFQMIDAMGVDAFFAATADLGVDVVFPNYDEGRSLTGLEDPRAIADALAPRYEGAIVALKLDEDGALVRDRDGRVTEVPPESNRLVDATGAGDAFAGAFLSRWLRDPDPAAAARFAVRVSEWVIEQIGARAAVDERLREVLAEG